MPRALLYLAALLSLSLPLHSHALVYVEAQHGVLAAKISEEITPGDYEQLLKELRANPGKFERKILLLDSIGGSAPEAMRIGRLLRESGFEVLVPKHGVCQGSCVYLLAAGVKRTINGHVALRKPPFTAGDSALAQAAHGKQSFSPARYLQAMGVNVELAQAIYQVPNGRLRLLSNTDLMRYRLN